MPNGLPVTAGVATKLTLALLLSAFGSQIAGGTEWPAEFVEDSDLHSVSFVDASQGWAVGDRGLILRTRDGGKSWQRQRCPNSRRLNAVKLLDANQGWIASASVQPYSYDGAGSILSTDDGGESWLPMKRAALSWLYDLSLDQDRTAIAVGSRSPLFPSGIFYSEDRGQGWHPLAVSTHDDWIGCDSRGGKLLLVGRHQALAGLTTSRPKQGVASAEIPNSLRCGCWLGNGTALVGGDGGTLFGFAERQWLDASTALPASVKQQFDFHAIAAVGERVWLAGAPGNVVWRSDDGGHRWQTASTGQSLPINDLCFVDGQNGWAVGVLGTILATKDGGATWKVQRGADRRLGALIVCTSSTQAPWMLAAHLSAEHRVRTRVLVIEGAHESPSESYSVALGDRLSSAAVAVGASGAEQWSEFPVAPSIIQPNQHAIEVGWLLHQRAKKLNRQGMELLTDRLSRAIRQWQPEMIVLQADPKRPDWSRLLTESLIAAHRHAASATPGPLESPSWQAGRIVLVTTNRPAAHQTNSRLMPSRLSLALGQSIGELVAASAIHVTSKSSPIGSIFLSSIDGSPVRSDLGSGFASKNDVQRAAQKSGVVLGSIDSLTRRIQQQENARRLLERASSQEDAARSLQLVGQFPRDSAARFMLQIADRQISAGDTGAGRQTLLALREQYREQPAAYEALRRLFVQSCSEESRVRATAHRTTFDDPPRDLDLQQPVIQATHTTEQPSLRSPQDWLEKLAPITRDRPEWQLAVASSKPATQTASLLNRMKRSAPTKAWRQSAAAEIWLNDRSRAAPKPVWNCGTGTRPTLDGTLDDSLWSDASLQNMGLLKQLDHPLRTRLWIARDHEFLYLAAECQRLAELTYPRPTRQDRPRDTAPGEFDRVDFFMDVNRDYLSGWRLGFDSRGWAIDSESGDDKWNPKWYVAASLDEKNWTVEAAIPLSELVSDPTNLNDAWNISARRIVPGWGWQSWPEEAGAQPEWQETGLLIMNSMGNR